MATFRTQKTNNFTVVRNEFINDPMLSAKAKGILLYLLSKPDDWETRLEDIEAHMADGIDSIKSGVRELKGRGYMVRNRRHLSDGRFQWETLVLEVPISIEQNAETPAKSGANPSVENPSMGVPSMVSPSMDFPSMVNPSVEKPSMENPLLLNTDRPNTDLLRTDLTKEEKKVANATIAIAPQGKSVEQPKPDLSQIEQAAEQPPSGKAGKSGSKKGSARRRPRTEDIYETLKYREKFESAWQWYCRKVAAIPPDRQGRRPSPGVKSEAAEAWRDYLEADERLEQFKAGLMGYDFNQIGVPHFCRFIRDGIWENAIAVNAPVNGAFIPAEQAITATGEPDWANHPRRDEWLEAMDSVGSDFIRYAPEDEKATRQAFAKWVIANRQTLAAIRN